jgi:hypothetical protein
MYILKCELAHIYFSSFYLSSLCEKNDLFYQSICYPVRLLKNSSDHHLRWLACLKGPCFLYNSIAHQTACPNPSPPSLLANRRRVWTFDLEKSHVRGRYDCIRDIRRSHCQPFCACMMLSGSEHVLAPSWSRENFLVKIFCLLCVCSPHQRVINSNTFLWWIQPVLKNLCSFLCREYINHIHLLNFILLPFPLLCDLFLVWPVFHNIAVFVLGLYSTNERKNVTFDPLSLATFT